MHFKSTFWICFCLCFAVALSRWRSKGKDSNNCSWSNWVWTLISVELGSISWQLNHCQWIIRWYEFLEVEIGTSRHQSGAKKNYGAISQVSPQISEVIPRSWCSLLFGHLHLQQPPSRRFFLISEHTISGASIVLAILSGNLWFGSDFCS